MRLEGESFLILSGGYRIRPWPARVWVKLRRFVVKDTRWAISVLIGLLMLLVKIGDCQARKP